MRKRTPGLISICVPAYEMGGQGVRMLAQLVDSCLAQTYKNIEIVVSDHSVDDSIQRYCATVPIIRYVRNQLFRGSSSYNMNNALDHASGQFIKPLFQDDLFASEHALQKMVSLIGHGHWSACSCIHYRDAPTQLFYPHRVGWATSDGMIRGINVIGSPSCIFYESNDLRFDNNLIWLMDCDFYVSLYKKYGPPALIDDICIKNRIWDGNVSNKIATEAIRKREEVYVAKKHDRKYRVCVLTALAGSRDMVIDPGVVHPGVEYHAFVDRAWPCRVWKQHPLEQFTEDSRYAGRRNAKIYKIMPHLFLPDHDFSIWVDPTHEVVHDTDKLCDMLGEADIGVFEHRERHCAYDEADEILRLRYDDPGNVHALKSFFVEKGFPRGYGLYEIPVMVRRNNAATQRMALKWWEMICRYSSRDQISFSYIRWKLGIVSQVLPGYANGINPATGTVGYNDLIPQVRRHGSVGGSFFQNNLDRVHQV